VALYQRGNLAVLAAAQQIPFAVPWYRMILNAREISSRSTSVSDNLERRRAAGRMPPVSASIRWIEEWFRSNSCAIFRSESPAFQRSHINAFWLSV